MGFGLGEYNSSAITLSSGAQSVLQLDANGNLKVAVVSGGSGGGGGGGSVSGNVGLNAGTNIVGKVGIDQTTPGVTNGVQINAPIPAGTNIIGKVGIDQTTPGTTNGFQLNGGPGTSSNNPVYVNTGAGLSGAIKNSGQIVSGSIAPGASAVLAAGLITGNKLASLEHVAMSSANAMRYDIQYIPNGGGSAITYYTYFTTPSNLNISFNPMPGGEFTLPSADGSNTKFQVLVTNQDSSTSNPAYVTIVWLEN